MNTDKRHRFPSDIISDAVWLYYRFNLSHCDVEGLLAERDISVSNALKILTIRTPRKIPRNTLYCHPQLNLRLIVDPNSKNRSANRIPSGP